MPCLASPPCWIRRQTSFPSSIPFHFLLFSWVNVICFFSLICKIWPVSISLDMFNSRFTIFTSNPLLGSLTDMFIICPLAISTQVRWPCLLPLTSIFTFTLIECPRRDLSIPEPWCTLVIFSWKATNSLLLNTEPFKLLFTFPKSSFPHFHPPQTSQLDSAEQPHGHRWKDF